VQGICLFTVANLSAFQRSRLLPVIVTFIRKQCRYHLEEFEKSMFIVRRSSMP